LHFLRFRTILGVFLSQMSFIGLPSEAPRVQSFPIILPLKRNLVIKTKILEHIIINQKHTFIRKNAKQTCNILANFVHNKIMYTNILAHDYNCLTLVMSYKASNVSLVRNNKFSFVNKTLYLTGNNLIAILL
jgi:hypothetical protein